MLKIIRAECDNPDLNSCNPIDRSSSSMLFLNILNIYNKSKIVFLKTIKVKNVTINLR